LIGAGLRRLKAAAREQADLAPDIGYGKVRECLVVACSGALQLNPQ
jgi:hypothetical protein